MSEEKSIFLCHYCQAENPIILRPVPVIVETFYKGMTCAWVCVDCNLKHCEYVGHMEEIER